MNKLFLIALAAGTLAGSAAAQTSAAQTSQISGYATLITIGNARGIKPALTTTFLAQLRAGSAAYKTVNEKLRISPGAFAQLLRHGNNLAPTALVTQAALEASLGKTLFGAAVAGLIKQNSALAAADQAGLNRLLNDPAALAAANRAADAAGQPVTPRGGGN